MKRTVRFTLNSRKFGSQTTVEGVHQGDDNSCELVITITNGNKTLDLSSETTIATMCGVKPDGTKISRPCAIVNNNIVYTLEKQDTAVSGNVLYQVVVSTDNGISQDLTATAKFTVAVMKNIDIPIYRVLESEPTDWSTNYTAYYRLLDNKYTAISDNNCPAFSSDTFYYLINPNYESKDDYGAFHSALVRVENLIGRASDILTILDSKINYTDVYTQAEVDTALANKADTSDVESALAEKADKTEVESSLAEKADTSDVESALAEKADKVEVENSLAEKANKTEVDESLSEKEAVNNKITDKRFITDSKTNYPSIAFLEDYYYNVDEIDALLDGKDISTDTGTASITHTWDGTILTITTDSGTSSADLKGEQGIQGEKGETGADGKDGIDGVGIASTDMKTSTEDGGINVITFNFTDGKTTTCSFRNGSKGSQGEKGEAGADGKDGIDGVSPTVIVAENTDTSYKLSITNANGTITTPNLKGADGANGTDGKDGADGYTPVKGVDYFTEEDKAELVEAVYALIADGNEVAY